MNRNTKIGIGVLVVILVIAALVYNAFGANTANATLDNQPVSQAQLSALSSIANNQTLANKVGSGVIQVFPKKVAGANIVINGKPTVVYMGADYCPYCAATRWPLIIALMRFGSFSGLRYMTSDSDDVFPITPTFTFANATYTSQYINFMPAEFENRSGAPLQIPNAIQNATYAAYDSSGIPFIDFNNMSVQDGASYSPQLIYQSNWNNIIQQLGNTNSTITQSIIGSADVFTAQICAMDNYTPSSVCDASYVKQVLGS